MSEVPKKLIEAIVEARREYAFPSEIRPTAQRFVLRVLSTLFPHFSEHAPVSAPEVEYELHEIQSALKGLHEKLETMHGPQDPSLPGRFMDELEGLYGIMREDADAIFQGDPAAKSVDEVILTYPGFFAIAVFRIANALHRLGYPLLPRLLTEFAHEKTGVDIHPGARIGRRFVIDHGTGVVIGESTVIGNRVKLYQGVTLGAVVVKKALADKKRHPTIEDDVIIYAGATILGGDTVVGHDSVVAGNAWLTESVPPSSVVSRSSEIRPRKTDGEDGEDFAV